MTMGTGGQTACKEGVRAASTFPVDTWVDVAPFSELENAAEGAGVEERIMGFGPLKNTQERPAQVVGSWCLALGRAVWVGRDPS